MYSTVTFEGNLAADVEVKENKAGGVYVDAVVLVNQGKDSDGAEYAATVANGTDYATANNAATHRRTAMQSRTLIDQAAGIFMARHSRTADEALDMLNPVAEQQHIPLHELARTTVASTVE